MKNEKNSGFVLSVTSWHVGPASVTDAGKKAQKQQGQTPQPPAPVQPQAEQLTMEVLDEN